MILRHLAFAALLGLAIPAFADSATTPTVNNMSAPEFLAWHDDVARRATGKDFEALSRGEKDQLAAAQGEIRSALAGKASMADLDDATKITVFNAHEKVVALVNKAEDERMVCTQKKRLGSHRHQLECRTVAQIRADRDAARNMRARQFACSTEPGNLSCRGS